MGNDARSNKIDSFNDWLNYRISEKRPDTILGISLIFLGIAIAFIAHETDQTKPAILGLVTTGISILIVCLKYPLSGLYFTSIFSSLFALPGRFFNVQSPVGILVEVFTYVLLIAVLSISTLKKESNTAFWNNSITVILIVIVLFYIIELANPAQYSKLGWLFYFRKQVSYLLFYFIAYTLLNSYSKIKFFLNFWIALVSVIALYGIKQQLFGLADFEKRWLESAPVLMRLYYQDNANAPGIVYPG